MARLGFTRRRAIGAAALLLAGAPAVAAILVLGDDPASTSPTEQADAASSTQRTAEVERRDLKDTVEVDGTLGYGERQTIQGPGSGTITALPENGSVIDVGEPLYWIDGEPGPVLLRGTLPMWRSLAGGVSDGPDVAQLETNLVELGFADAGSLTVDETFTSATAAAISRWQSGRGVDETGRLERGDAWISEGPLRVADTIADPGDPAAGDVLALTGADRRVHVELPARYGQYAGEGDSVDLELADGTAATGTITHVATVATVVPGREGEPPVTTIPLEIRPEVELPGLDQSPVGVALTSAETPDALAVPLEAVVARADGAFAVEVVRGSRTHLVDVDLGAHADGWVEVVGGVAEGDTVVTA